MHRLFLFGEAERGQLRVPHYLKSLSELLDICGHPPGDSQGIPFAIQALLYKKEVYFFRVEEEGFSTEDYKKGIHLLQKEGAQMHLSAVGLPGVGNPQLIEAFGKFCLKNKALLIIGERDLFDLITG